MPRKWIGIRLSAVVAILGSAVALLFAGLMLFAAFVAPPPHDTGASPIPLKALSIGMAAMSAVISAWGISTAIAIFLRRRWARVSMLVFAALLTLMSAGGMLAIFFIQLPATPEGSQALTSTIRLAMAGFYGGLTAIGVWWLVLFNRSRTKEYFGGEERPSENARPLSISVIAWYLLINIVFIAPMAIFRLPAMMFGIVFTGWVTLLVYTAYVAVQIYLGTGLLHLQEGARIGTIAFCCFAAANSTVSFLGPGYGKMMRQMQAIMPRFFPAGSPATMPGPMWIFALLTAAFCALPIFFLVRRRSAFHSR